MQLSEEIEGEHYAEQPLDHLSSTSQTNFCPFGAPFAAIVVGCTGRIIQTCCNHWECPVCGPVRAETEYRRICSGAEELAKSHNLYFWTLTCRGREISLEEAERNYYAWTNVLLTNARAVAKRKGDYWSYCQVTERQHKTRLHPHSHLISTFIPHDAVSTKDEHGYDVYESAWFSRANASAGLGSRHKISRVESSIAVARYVAKYMKKQTMTDSWPRKWKRVRYSLNWPKLPAFTPVFQQILLSRSDWHSLDKTDYWFETSNDTLYEYAKHRCISVIRTT